MSGYGSGRRDEPTMPFDPAAVTVPHDPGAGTIPFGETVPTVSLSETVPAAAAVDDNETVPVDPRDVIISAMIAPPQAEPLSVPSSPDTPRTRYDLTPGRPAVEDSRGFSAPLGELRIGKGIIAPPQTSRRPDLHIGRRRVVGLLTHALSAVATVVLIAAATWTGWQWWQHWHNRLAVTHVSVAPAQLMNGACDVEYDVVGTIATNGRAGTISYEWIRSTGETSGTLRHSVASGDDSTTVHLYWRFTGQGSMTATATLHVISPTDIQTTTPVAYSCG